MNPIYPPERADAPPEPDERDILELTREERQARYHDLNTVELIELVEAGIESVDNLRRENAILRARLAHVSAGRAGVGSP